MKNKLIPGALTAIVLLISLPAAAADLREACRAAAADRRAAEQLILETEAEILNDKHALEAAVTQLEEAQKDTEDAIARLQTSIEEKQSRRQELNAQWSASEVEFREISGIVRIAARDLESVLRSSRFTAGHPERLERIELMLSEGHFPDLEDISAMTTIFFDEIQRAGEVSGCKTSFIGRDGTDRRSSVFHLGKLTSFYRDGEEVGFLTASPTGATLHALSSLPSRGIQRQLRKYSSGETDVVPIDLSGGSALRQISQPTSLADQLRAGGPIVWPIGAIALAALLMILYKVHFLHRVHARTGQIMATVNRLAASGDWRACEETIQKTRNANQPVTNVIRAGLAARGEDRETLDSVLQESILHELPRLERFMPALAIFGAIAPLLGLLGTVTGMIDTFRTITLFGTSDPRLMSGGISEALITTELGLAVAIPIMLLHTFLSRRVDHIVGDMEEKAVHLSNIILKERRRNGHTLAVS